MKKQTSKLGLAWLGLAFDAGLCMRYKTHSVFKLKLQHCFVLQTFVQDSRCVAKGKVKQHTAWRHTKLVLPATLHVLLHRVVPTLRLRGLLLLLLWVLLRTLLRRLRLLLLLLCVSRPLQLRLHMRRRSLRLCRRCRGGHLVRLLRLPGCGGVLRGGGVLRTRWWGK